MKKNICCSVDETIYNELAKAKFMLTLEKKTLSDCVSETIKKYSQKYDETYKKV